MRTKLLLSTAAVALMLASPAAFAQSNPDTKPEGAKEQTHHNAKQDERGQREPNENKAAQSQQSKPDQNKAAQSEQPKQQSTSDKQERQSEKNAQQEKSEKSERSAKDRNDQQRGNAAATKSPSTAGQNASDQQKSSDTQKNATGDASKNAPAAQRNDATRQNATTNDPATANKTGSTANKAGSTTDQTNTRNSAQQNTTHNTNVNAQLTPEKQTRISETISRTRDIAPPVRDLRVSVDVGTRVPEHVRLHRVPREIVSIEPAYREYEYFTTERDVVIVNPRTRQVVTRIPRDASSARAQGGSSTQVSTTSSGSTAASGSTGANASLPCQVMRREASGQTVPVDPAELSRSTTGSGASGTNRLAVTVQAPNGQTMPPIALPDQTGQIVVATDGGDCKITIEPGAR